MTGSVKAAAEGARGVESAISDARNEAEVNREVVENAVSAMTEIEESSNQISQIIGVIDDIAFQTNLLALNAGVEAARAGEAGRGFAVVASEVRALAQRSSEAATEIKTLISNSSSQVERGVDLVGKAGQALQAIVGQVGHISGLVSGIAEGASEQSTGLNEINLGVAQLDQVTQQNAAMVEQATAASQLLNNDAARLTDLISSFETGNVPAHSPQSVRQEEQAPGPEFAAAGTDFSRPDDGPAAVGFNGADLAASDPAPAAPAQFSAHGADADGGWLDMEPMPASDGMDDFVPEPLPAKATGTDDTVWKDF
jgi:methyl-accepting chemotaxis protein